MLGKIKTPEVPSKGAVHRTLAVSYEYIRTWGTPGEVKGRVSAGLNLHSRWSTAGRVHYKL
jgi:hypothetical protein